MPNLYRSNIPQNENRDGIFPPQKQKCHPNKNKNNKKDFKTLKKNTIKSLNDVEYFLNNFGNFIKSVKLFKLLK